MQPIVYYGNLLLSGTLSGSLQDTDNPVRLVADGSVNLGYTITEDVSPTLHSGQLDLVLTSAQQPVAFIFPRCALVSGMTVILQSMDDVAGTNLSGVITASITSGVSFFKQDLPGAVTDRLVWRVLISGVSGLVPAKLHEVQLATVKTQVAQSPQVGVTRTRVRQFTRIPVPGGQPFTKRNGPRLRKYAYTFVLVSGAAENDPVRDFVDAVEGGESFTFQDDLGACYWAELLGNDIPEADSAGISTWALTFQEVSVVE